MARQGVNIESIGSYFESLPDPRHTRNRKHLLSDIVVIAVGGLVCGSDGPTAIHRGATNRSEWLNEFLRVPNGIPSRDGLRRLLMALKPEAFQKCFRDGIAAAVRSDDGGRARLIAIDGKTCRGSHDPAEGLGPLHIVSAWAREEGIALGQVATEQKSNAITAIPLLLKPIDLTAAVITIDAMGCQKEIARDIVAGGGDFVIAVKDNQPKLREAIETYFRDHLERDLQDLTYRNDETVDRGHGRIEERSYDVTKIPSDFAFQKEWPWIKAIGYAVRIVQHADGRETDDVQYDILSRYLSGKRFGEASRGHWSIESMHWVLDVAFREDDSRTRERTLGNNLSWLRRFAITLLKRHTIKDSIKGKMLRCLMSTDFLEEILTFHGD
ncbi:ISAs1 family transposase [Fimbriiglobus ruber]|uniref:Mobile element protein n=1 Tax=Fimbriiglobus ruber TaxID=1908690 RepID=A0A225DFR3_9BACT|nr:ISAs1 family transposase [Fimbriiglobus ruber]OWK34927.1 Mobile element protein [Fimbriiglobus ruber]